MEGLGVDERVATVREFFAREPRTFAELKAMLPDRDPSALAYAVRTHLPLEVPEPRVLLDLRTELHHKDLGIALAAGREYGVALPVTAIVDQMFLSMRQKGWGGEDHSALLRVIEELSEHEIG